MRSTAPRLQRNQVLNPDALLALRVNGADLSLDHGYPGPHHRAGAARRALHEVGRLHRLPGGRDEPSFRRLYGDHLLHLHRAAWPRWLLGAYTISVLGVDQLFNPRVWWQSIAVWFAVAVIGHDLILFPLYALAERLLPDGAPTPPKPRPVAPGADRQLPPNAHAGNGVDVR